MPELPVWFRQELPDPVKFSRMRSVLRQHGLHTVCEGARCPNTGRCWNKGAATFMILGDHCTRACRFCAVKNGLPLAVDPDEPWRVADAARALGLKYVVITSVTRDDLVDEGAGQFAATVRAIKETSMAIKVELLVPDFSARQDCLEAVLAAGPDVFGHNIETVRRLSPVLRPQADHDRSLKFLGMARTCAGDVRVKSGLMVGLGETDEEVLTALRELKDAGCDVVTVGQYLSPAADGRQLPVARFVTPDIFDMYRREGMAMGIRHVVSAPLVRSSFLAEETYNAALEAVRT
ncbi:MAG: lipoyl synthase [Candidatus Omnitrophica bacterium]|nr:lipoyl synthase [Candidatus Omnitrophota bacterium]